MSINETQLLSFLNTNSTVTYDVCDVLFSGFFGSMSPFPWRKKKKGILIIGKEH